VLPRQGRAAAVADASHQMKDAFTCRMTPTLVIWQGSLSACKNYQGAELL